MVHENPRFSEQKWTFFQLEKSESGMFQISIILFHLSFILIKKIKIGEPFFSRKKCQIPIRNLKKKSKYPKISEKKWIFFHFPKKNWNFFQISINLFYLSFNLKKRKKKLENLFFRDPQIFGTKVDFFPIGKIGIRNVPNFNKFIWP